MRSLQIAYAPREALDPGEGEAVLGQALHDHSLPYPPPSLPTSRVDFSRRLAVYVWNFHQVPAPIQTFSTRALLTFPDGWRAELLTFPECRLRIRVRF